MAQIYVGTWGKYNNGSIDGAWISLDKFNTYETFLAECKRVHADEVEPEFMIQDHELPEGLGCGDWLSREEFEDIITAMREEEEENAPAFTIIDYSEKAIALIGDTRQLKEQLKQIGGRFNPRLTCGAGWVFPKSTESKVRALIAGQKVAESAEQSEPDEYKQAFEDFLQALPAGKDAKYYRKYYVGAVKMGEGWVLIEKHHIENAFCWSDEGAELKAYKHITSNEERLSEYFLSENINTASQKIRRLSDQNRSVIMHTAGDNRVCVETVYDIEQALSHGCTELTPAQVADIIKAEQWGVAQFEKRLHAYLKRYGTSKLRTWTYWADR